MINLYDIKDIFVDVVREREAQFLKWGEQIHPFGNDPDTHGIHEHNYKLACDTNFTNGCGTWIDILLEEAFEVAAAKDESQLRMELIQLIAVSTAIIQQLDQG